MLQNLLKIFMKGFELFGDTAHRFFGIFDEMQFFEQRKHHLDDRFSHLLAFGKQQQQHDDGGLYQKTDRRKQHQIGNLPAEKGVSRQKKPHGIKNERELIDQIFLNHCRARITRSDSLPGERDNLHRLCRNTHRSNAGVKLTHHHRFDATPKAVIRTGDPDNQAGEPRVDEQLDNHAAKGRQKPSGRKIVNILHQIQKSAVRKSKVAQHSNGKCQKDDVEQSIEFKLFRLLQTLSDLSVVFCVELGCAHRLISLSV